MGPQIEETSGSLFTTERDDLPDHPEINRALALFTETRLARIENGYPAELDGSNEESCPFFLLNVSGWDLSDPQHSLNSWVNL